MFVQAGKPGPHQVKWSLSGPARRRELLGDPANTIRASGLVHE